MKVVCVSMCVCVCVCVWCEESIDKQGQGFLNMWMGLEIVEKERALMTNTINTLLPVKMAEMVSHIRSEILYASVRTCMHACIHTHARTHRCYLTHISSCR